MKNKMENAVNIKNFICGSIGAVSAFVISALGGYSPILGFLLGAMAVDFLLGLTIGATRKSPKSENGGLSSNIIFKGLAKKVGILVLVWLGAQVDIVFNIEATKYLIIVGYLVNEVISITENLGLLGVVKIDAVTKMIDILVNKTENKEEEK